ncbi:MAG: PilZ domain-containing protein [Nitrospirae bacterium]|nr:PilZ domain-containing protein [Nitrospirota bacterium]
MVVEPRDIKHKDRKVKNKREFFRLVERISIDVQLLKEHPSNGRSGVKEYEKDGKPSEQNTMDMSAGGLQFFSNVYCRENSYVDITLYFKKTDPPFDSLTVRAKVMRTVQVENSQHYNIGVQYVDINQKARTHIERYIFIRQREMIAEKRIGFL